jgi:uncharacterized protein YecT (DUF1311 family)
MDNLTAQQVTLLIAASGIVGGFIGWLGKGVTFLLTRWWTGSPKQERATYLNSVADLAGKLRANGMTWDEVRQFEAVVQNPSVQSSLAATQVVEQLSADADAIEPEAFQNNVAMKMRMSAAYEVANAKLNQALMDLRLLMGGAEWEQMEEAQKHWKAYRDGLECSALHEYEGGTNATLAMAFVGMAETERRADEIRAQVKERARR